MDIFPEITKVEGKMSILGHAHRQQPSRLVPVANPKKQNAASYNLVSSLTLVAADFEYSKDWHVTDSHRLSFYHVQNAPATLFIPFLYMNVIYN